MKPLSSAVFFRARSKKVRWDGVIGYAAPRSRIVYAPLPMPPAAPLGRRNAVRVPVSSRSRPSKPLWIRRLFERLHVLYRLLGLQPITIVGIDIDRADDTEGIDHEPARHW